MKTIEQHEQRRELIEKGSYAKKQILCKDCIVSWSHRSRFAFGCKLIDQYSGGTLLDYGFGDGTFLALTSHLFERAVGVDTDVKQVKECSVRFSGISNLSFLSAEQLAADEHNGRYELIVCMEVLEHCLPDVLENVLSDLGRLVKSDGTVIISVPIETGPTLLAKQLLRRAAGWRNLGDYKYFEKYGWRDFCKMLLANQRTSISRPVYFADSELRLHPFYGHKGFNWRALGRRLQNQFTVEQIRFSPAGWSHGFASSQAWFVCKPWSKPEKQHAR